MTHSDVCHESMGWVTMQMMWRLFFLSYPYLHLGLSTAAWTLKVCHHIPWPHVPSSLLRTAAVTLLQWTAATYRFVSRGMARDSPGLQKHLCSSLSHSCTGPYGPDPFGLKRLLLLPRYYTTLTLSSDLTRYLQKCVVQPVYKDCCTMRRTLGLFSCVLSK
jgi:hypothetical protein